MIDARPAIQPALAAQGSRPGDAALIYVGHATVLIELDGVRILTDPLLRFRTAHLRRLPPVPDLSNMGPIDAVLISHLHWDHLHPPSLRLLDRSTRIIAPNGAGPLLRRLSFRNVEELAPSTSVSVGPVSVMATYAEHGGYRPPFGPRAESLGFLVSGTRRVYFAGDTDLFAGMDALGPGLTAALLPVWGYGPLLGAGHLDPRRAAEALTRLRPDFAVPIHWGTIFPPGLRWLRPSFLEFPPRDFVRYAAALAPDVDVRVLAPGERLELPNVAT